MTAPPSLTIVVPTWNRAQLLEDALQALADQEVDPGRYEVVVVDDGSQDDTAEVVAHFASRAGELEIRYVGRPNGGLNAARNAGIVAARAEVVAFIDDDELVPPGYVGAVLAGLDAHPEASGVGGPYLDDPRGGVRTCDRCSLGAAQVTVGGGAGHVHRLLGGNMAIRRSAFDAVGRFHEELSGRGDETEWYARATAAGHRFWYEQDLFLWHRRDTMSLLDLCRIQFRQGRALPRSRDLMGSRWRPHPARTARYVGHGVRRRCGRGFILAARDLGALVSWLGLRSKR